jgi:CSLREA domain-containing protein
MRQTGEGASGVRHRVASTAALIVFVLAASIAAPPNTRAASAAVLRLSAPSQVSVGEAIPLTLEVVNAADLAGYETAVLFDTAAAEFAGLHQRDSDIQRVGREVGSLAAPELPTGSAIGLYSCAAAGCAAGVAPQQARGASGTVKLATVDLLPLQAGTLEIALAATKFVDSAGNLVTVDIPARVVSVQVGPASAGPRFAAPASPWSLAAVAAAAAGSPDLTGDGQVTRADVAEAELEWTRARELGAPCGGQIDPQRDINRDGCVDVADLQALAAGSRAPQTPPVAEAALTFTVNSTSDAADANAGNRSCRTSAGVCTLRAAIEEANRHAGPDIVAFNIPGGGVHTIWLTKELPTLWGGGTTIDGYTQPGAAPNTAALASNAKIRVEVVGTGPRGSDGLPITSAGNVIRGLAIYNAYRPIWIYGPGAHDNWVVGDFVGTNAAGTFVSPDAGSGAGVYIAQQAARNHIGQVGPANRNVISGNGRTGVALWFEGTDANAILNNLVGFNPSGTRVLGNKLHGIDMNSGPSYNVVGGTAPGQRNVVVGSVRTGIEVSHSGSTSFNRVIGNFVGTDLTGTRGVSRSGNGWFGIQVKDRVADNTVVSNVVGYSRLGGIRIDEFGNCCVRRNHFAYNRVGVGASGGAIPNRVAGFYVTAGDSIIGPGNIIAHNPTGIRVEGNASDLNTITRNSIYGNTRLGIDLAPIGRVNANDSGDGDGGPNQQMNFPVLEAATTQWVRGSACAGCVVEVFVADGAAGAYGEGKTFVGAATAAPNGVFVAPVRGVGPNMAVTATATSPAGNTSEFARNMRVAGPGRSPALPIYVPLARR